MKIRAFPLVLSLCLGGLGSPLAAAEKNDPATGVTTGVPLPASPAAKVDINTASPAALEALPGVGTDFANAVIANRPYKSLDDLQRVPGIGPEKLKLLRDKVTVSPADATPTKSATVPIGPPSKSAPLKDGKATPAKDVTERYDRAHPAKPPAEKPRG